MKSIRPFFLSLALSLGAIMAYATNYNNPIIPGFHPDPSVCKANGKYYLVCSSFQYFPAVPIFESSDMLKWEQIGYVIDRNEQLDLKRATSWTGIYAPTIRFHDGIFYMITTNVGGKGNFMVTAKDPRGPWSMPIYLKQGGIDPSLYFDGDRCYMVSNPDNAITLCEIDKTTGKQLTDSKVIWRGTGGRYPEGPHIYKKDNYYYLLISEGGTEIAHKLTMARSKNIFGPYESNPHNPIFTHCSVNAQSSNIQGTGHGDLIEDYDGNWWMSMLAFRQYEGSYHHIGRETFLAPVVWEKDKWPVVNGNNPLVVKTDIANTGCKISNSAAKGFGLLSHEWIHIQNPITERYRISDNKLTLIASASSLTENDHPTFMGRRQQSASCSVISCVDASGLNKGDEAGITAYQIHNGHCEIFIKRALDGQLSVYSRVTLMSVVKESVPMTISDNKVTLTIQCSPKKYSLGYMTDNQHQPCIINTVDTQLLSTEVVGGFTGCILGMYATGSGSASFDYFDYQQK